MLTKLYRRVDGKNLVVYGHFNKQEIIELKQEGWRLDEPQVNKNGIPVGRAV